MSNVQELPRFISYHIHGTDARKPVPIATGHTHEDCQALAITRTLVTCELHGGIQTQDRTADVDFPTFMQLTEFLNHHFMALDAEARGE